MPDNKQPLPPTTRTAPLLTHQRDARIARSATITYREQGRSHVHVHVHAEFYVFLPDRTTSSKMTFMKRRSSFHAGYRIHVHLHRD